MKYILLIHMGEDAIDENERESCYQKSAKLARELDSDGRFLSANPLQPVSTATSVRVREGKRYVTDGPFAETREHLGGYFLIDVKSREEAIAVASRIPAAHFGSVEVREVVELEGLPKPDPDAETRPGMKYMLLSYNDEKYWQNAGEAAVKNAFVEATRLTHHLNAKKQYLLASPLKPSSTATTVRSRDGKLQIIDGPFAETREVLGGFYLINVSNLDEAIEIAGKHPGVRYGTVEIRPIVKIGGLPVK